MSKRPGRLARRRCGTWQALFLESLEDRRLLDGTSALVVEPAADELPWQNPVYQLDVNHDGSTTPIDALNIINRILAGGTGELPPPDSDPPEFYYDTSGDNRLTPRDVLFVINGILARPQVVVSSLTP